MNLPGWDVTRESIEVKIEDIQEPNERRESCDDVAKETILARAADVNNPNGTVE
jgi:hypothetical protein